ncbi:MAG TPA: S8 family serine peptidase [Thermoanaerobaculia bacterium]|nr:S8 family serine peptidase [Thermoanaerobaculia bacterium]
MSPIRIGSSFTRRRLLAGSLLALAALAAGSRGRADADHVRVLVRFAPGVDAAERGQLARRFAGAIRRDLGDYSIAALELPAAEVAALRRDPGVELVEPEPIYHAAALALSELQPALDNGLYGLVLTKAVDAQARHVDGAGARVCIADTGIDAHHPDLAGAYSGGFDLVDNDDDPDIGPDPGLGGHGTMVAGIIAAALNRKGVHGIAPSAQILHARVLGAEGTAPSSRVMEAVRRLVEHEGCRVVNLSLGSLQRSDVEADFYSQLLSRHDVLVIAAAGNEAAGVDYPAAYPGVVAVGAVDRDAGLASFSNTGSEVDLAAPGVDVLTTVPRGSGGESYVSLGRASWPASSFLYGGYTTAKGLRGKLVDCGTGNTPEEFPRSVRGQIALMRRGGAYFSVKVENAMNAGARGAVIYNNVLEGLHGSLQTATASDGRPWIPVVLVSLADGETLLTQRKAALLFSGPTDWDAGSGTSFAAPYVAGAAALVLSVDPSLSRDQVLGLLETTARDLGEPGLDPQFGWGLIDVDAATRAAAGL